MTAREAHVVELVAADGTPTGSATVEEAHRAPGRLHRAFSVFLRDPDGRVLLQQRATAKTRFPLRWANTCCGHPRPGEPLAAAAARRVEEELGVTAARLDPVGVYAYYAEDPATGRVEYEYDHVLLGDLPAGAELSPDPAEVAGCRWVTVDALLAELAADPRTYAPWLPGVAGRLAEHLGGAVGGVSDGGVPVGGSAGVSVSASAGAVGGASAGAPVGASAGAVGGASAGAPVGASAGAPVGTDESIDGPERPGGR